MAQANQGPLTPGDAVFQPQPYTGGKYAVTPDGEVAPVQGAQAAPNTNTGNFLSRLDAPFKAARDVVAKGINFIDTMGGIMPGSGRFGGGMVTPDMINPVPGSLPQAVGMGAAAAIPGAGAVRGALRSGAAGVGAGGTAALQGRPDALRTGIEQGLGQAAAEGTFGVGRAVVGQRRAKSAYQREQEAIAAAKAAHEAHGGQMEAFKQAERQRLSAHRQGEIQNANQYRDQRAQLKQSEQARIAREEATQASARAAHNEQQAGQIASTVKSQVPAWKNLGNSAKDLWNMVYGEGWKLVQDRYDAALKGVIESGRGTKVQIRRDAAEALGVSLGPGPKGTVGPGPLGKSGDTNFAMVDAGELAASMTGKWNGKGTRSAYRQAARALDEAGIGDPAARQEYRNASSFRAFTDKSQMLTDKQGNQVFQPEKAQKALGQLRANQEIMGRGNTELFRTVEGAKPLQPSPIAPARTPPPYQRGPAFQPGTPPQAPPPVPKQTITHGPAGAASIPGSVAGVAGGVLGHEVGKSIGHPFGGYLAGHAAGQALGGRVPVYRGAPQMAPPGILGRGARAAIGQVATQNIHRAWDYIMGDDSGN